MTDGRDTIPTPTDGGNPRVGRGASDAANVDTFGASVAIAVSRVRRWGKHAATVDGTRAPTPPKFASDASKARDRYLAAQLARRAASLDGADLRASDAATFARGVRARTDARAVGTDATRAIVTERAASVGRAVAGLLPSEAYGADRFAREATDGVRRNASDALLASRHGAARKSDPDRPLPASHLGPSPAMMGPGARILHIDPVATGPVSGTPRADSPAETEASAREYHAALVSLALSVKATDAIGIARLARGVRSCRISSTERDVFAALRHSVRRALSRALDASLGGLPA